MQPDTTLLTALRAHGRWFASKHGLPANVMLVRRPQRTLLREHLAAAHGRGGAAAVLVLKIHDFALLEEECGHQVAEAMLLQAAARLGRCLRPGDLLARDGNNRLVLLAPGVDQPALARALARRLARVFERPFTCAGHSCVLAASIGAALAPLHGANLDVVLQYASRAQRQAAAGRYQGPLVHGDTGVILPTASLQLRERLRQALERREFELHYQPQFDLDSGKVCGFEALMRWHPPGAAPVPPAEFIPAAEQCGLIVPIGAWVLEQACLQARRWNRAGAAPLTVAVNLSAEQFRHGDLVATVAGALARSGLAPGLLELELTESVLLLESEAAAQLDGLKALGVRLAIDDFGTGYANLAYLRRFQVNNLKIDQSFVRDLEGQPAARAIVGAIIQMARAMGLTIVAEGVETAAQLDRLRGYGCQSVQGYLFSPPVSAAACTTMLDVA